MVQILHSILPHSTPTFEKQKKGKEPIFITLCDINHIVQIISTMTRC